MFIQVKWLNGVLLKRCWYTNTVSSQYWLFSVRPIIFAGARLGTRRLQSVLFVSMETGGRQQNTEGDVFDSYPSLEIKISPFTFERRVLDL